MSTRKAVLVTFYRFPVQSERTLINTISRKQATDPILRPRSATCNSPVTKSRDRDITCSSLADLNECIFETVRIRSRNGSGLTFIQHCVIDSREDRRRVMLASKSPTLTHVHIYRDGQLHESPFDEDGHL